MKQVMRVLSPAEYDEVKEAAVKAKTQEDAPILSIIFSPHYCFNEVLNWDGICESATNDKKRLEKILSLYCLEYRRDCEGGSSVVPLSVKEKAWKKYLKLNPATDEIFNNVLKDVCGSERDLSETILKELMCERQDELTDEQLRWIMRQSFIMEYMLMAQKILLEKGIEAKLPWE